MIRLEPAPGGTLQVPVGVPDPDTITGVALDYAQVVALIIVVLVVGTFLMWLWRSNAVRMVLAIAAGGFIVYVALSGKG